MAHCEVISFTDGLEELIKEAYLVNIKTKVKIVNNEKVENI